MFTGIVEDLGRVVAVETIADAARLTVSGDCLDDVAGGESVAVNGVCLTVADHRDHAFTADVMRETLQRSTLGQLRPGDPVNLERAVTPTTRLGGHLVQGHVDGVGRVVARRPTPQWEEVDVELPSRLSAYAVEKGSIALDGVSLTIAELDGDQVTVSLIPATLARTTLGERPVGAQLNVEVDVLAKYVERQLAMRR